MKYLNQQLLVILSMSMFFISAPSQAAVKFSLGAKLLPGHTWSGSNDRAGEKEYESKATQLVLLAAMRSDRLYAAFSFQGAQYNFANPAPDIHDKTGSTQVSDESIKLGESDLTVGYYLTPHFSLFADIKSVAYTWTNSNHSLVYQGLGLGVSGYKPINPAWSLYGNFGLVGKMKVQSKSETIGSASGYALEFGGITKLTDKLSANVGLKLQGQVLRFDTGSIQTHGRGGIVLGVAYQF